MFYEQTKRIICLISVIYILHYLITTNYKNIEFDRVAILLLVATIPEIIISIALIVLSVEFITWVCILLCKIG
jgi:hypothetical protein